MNINEVMRLEEPCLVAIVGAGGKTSTLRRIAESLSGKVVISTTTHFGLDQVEYADKKLFLSSSDDVDEIIWGGEERIISITSSPIDGHRLSSLTSDQLSRLHERAINERFSILIEADGARMLPLKAPADHEPEIPGWVNLVVVAAGMSALGKPLNIDHVFRPELFGSIAGLRVDETITGEHLAIVLCDPRGGLKGIPAKAKRVLCLNQAENEKNHPEIMRIANNCRKEYDQVIICSLGLPRSKPEIYARVENTAAIILAAGGSTRMKGIPKPLIKFSGEELIDRAIITAERSGLSPIITVIGYEADSVGKYLARKPVEVVVNADWEKGQSTSIRAGLSKLGKRGGAAIFILVDQPFVFPELIEKLTSCHMTTLTPIIAPIVDDIRSNPVLFDRSTFMELMGLDGDSGGRKIIGHFEHIWVPWLDKRLLMDIDTPEDLERCADEIAE